MKKVGAFPQGTQRIARIGEISEPNAYVMHPVPAPEREVNVAVDAPVSDAELASAIVGGDAPVAARRTKRITSAYSTEAVVGERPILTVA